MPMLRATSRRIPSSLTGASSAGDDPSGSRQQEASSTPEASSTANSSPPSRAAGPRRGSTRAAAAPTSCSSSSPLWCPRVSLTSLNRSRSMSSDRAGRRSAAVEPAPRPRVSWKTARLGRPVSESCSAWCSRRRPRPEPVDRDGPSPARLRRGSRGVELGVLVVQRADVGQPAGNREDSAGAGAASCHAPGVRRTPRPRRGSRRAGRSCDRGRRGRAPCLENGSGRATRRPSRPRSPSDRPWPGSGARRDPGPAAARDVRAEQTAGVVQHLLGDVVRAQVHQRSPARSRAAAAGSLALMQVMYPR